MAEMTPQQAMDYAVQRHRMGRVAEAEATYRRILDADPRNAGALQMLARLYYETGRHLLAAQTLQKTIAIEPRNPELLSNLGSVLAGLDRLGEAETAVRKALELRPNSPQTHGNLANILLAQGRIDDAIAGYRQALALNPNAAETACNLGNALRKKGDLAGAIASYRRALQLRGDFVEAQISLAHALKEAKQFEESIVLYRRALTIRPDNHAEHTGLGNVLQEVRRFDEAIGEYRQAIAIRPDAPEAWLGLGTAFGQTKDLDQAIAAFREAVRILPTYADAHSNLGIALYEKGALEESIAAHRQAIALDRSYSEAYNNLGISLQAAGKPDEAVAALKGALSLRANYPEALNNLGLAYEDLGNSDEALAAYRRAVAIAPNYPHAQTNLANALKAAGQLDEALATYRQAAETAEFPWLSGNLLFAMHSHPDFGPEEILAEHRKWGDRFVKPQAAGIKPHENDRSPERKLKVGFVSPDFNRHPVGRFILPLMENLDRERFDVFCYSDVRKEDEVTEALKRPAATWRKTLAMSDQRLAGLIREDRIDILIDLAMHTKDNRLLVFARKPAPVQATYLAYCSTTGVDTIDYRITDPYLDPPGTEHLYVEKSVRLPNSYWCYQAHPQAGEVEPSPVARVGSITFGCLNSFSKVTPQAIAVWGRILANVAGSRMVLHCREGTHRHRVTDLFQKAGAEPHRINFVPRVTGRDYFTLYNQIDIGLDPFPFPGGTTTCDALWMGVPVITMRGRTAVSRGGFSILSNVGLRELVAESVDQYVELASSLATDHAKLAELRGSMRSRMLGSPLMDAAGFTRGFEAALREMWRMWTSALPSVAPALG